MFQKQDIKEIIQIVLLSSIFTWMVSGLYAWQSPSAEAPNNNSLPAVNVNSDPQTKQGPIWTSSFLTEGGGYFGGNVGIGQTNPQAKLHIGGTAGVDGIMFPDGTVQTTAAQ